jgi:hypothetical protein
LFFVLTSFLFLLTDRSTKKEGSFGLGRRGAE